MAETLQHPRSNKLAKIIAIVLLSLVLVAGAALGTVYVLSQLGPQKETVKQLTPEQKAAEAAKQNMSTGLGSESKGETAAAIAAYEEALKNYEAAGDKASVEAVKMKLNYLKSIK